MEYGRRRFWRGFSRLCLIDEVAVALEQGFSLTCVAVAMDDVIAVTGRGDRGDGGGEVGMVGFYQERSDICVPGSKLRIASFIVFDGRRPASWIRMFSKACR